MRLAILLALTLAIGNAAALLQGSKDQSAVCPSWKTKTRDGNWWSAASAEARSGFLEGTADCLTWVAHAQGFSGTPCQLTEKITRYYKSHPKDKEVLVIEVWQRVAAMTSTKPNQNSEVWKNPPWYLHGLWWRQSSEIERSAFLEGYFWCLRTQVDPAKDVYSRSLSFYVSIIDEYVRTHPKADDQAVATILAGIREIRSA